MPKSTPTPQIQVSKTNDAPVKYYKTRDVNKALEDANDGDTVVLAPGDYTSYNVFVPEDVYVLCKPGAILGYEFDNVQGFTSNIADLNSIGGAQDSSDLGGPSGVIYYIRPLRGTAIKNSNPDEDLAIEIHRIKDGQDLVIDEGDIQLFYQDENDQYQPITQLDEDSDGYFAELGREDIDGSRKVFVMDSSKPLTQDNIFDSITLADIQDGHGFVGWVNVTPSFTASQNEDGDFSPTFIELDPNFTFDGEVIDISNDSSFTFTATPDNVDGVDVFGDDNKVEVDTQTYFGSREKRQYTANWEAEYTGPSGKTFTFQLVETVYKAEDGKSSQTLQVIADNQAFKVDKDGNTSPEQIRLRAVTQNISGVGDPGGATVEWSVDDTDPNGLDITLRDEGGDPTTTGQTVYVYQQDVPDEFVTATIRASVVDDFVREPPVEDEIAIAKLIDGDPGFTVILSNENHTFPVDSQGQITSQNYDNGATTANIWRGTEKFSYDQNLSEDGTWRFQEFSDGLNEVTPEGAIEVEVDDIIGRVVPSNMTFPSAIVNVAIEARYKNNTRDVFQRQITYNKAQSGSDIKRLQLSANSQVFKVFEDGTVDPDPDGQGGVDGKITLQALLANLDEKPDDEVLWSSEPSYVLGTDVVPGEDARISGDGEEFELFYQDLKNTTGSAIDGIQNNEFADQVTIEAEIDVDGTVYSDQYTIFRLKEGSSAYTLALTNEAHAISTDKRGNPLANDDPAQRIPGAETDIRLFRGIQEITSSSDTTLEIQAIDDIPNGGVRQSNNNGGIELSAGDIIDPNLTTPPEIYISDTNFQLPGDVTASVDVRAKHIPNPEDGEQIVGRKTWNLSTAAKGDDGIQWLIKPLNGTAIKNSDPNRILEFEVRKLIAETNVLLERGSGGGGNDPQSPDQNFVDRTAIYFRNDVGGGDYEYVRACNVKWSESQSKYVTRTDTSGSNSCHPNQGTPLGPELSAEEIQGQATLYLIEADNAVTDDKVLETSAGEVNQVLDEIDVVDIVDGLGGGYIEASPGRQISITQTRPGGEGIVETTPLTVTAAFAEEGSTTASQTIETEIEFGYDTTFTSTPSIYVTGMDLNTANSNIDVQAEFLEGSGTSSVGKNAIANDQFGQGNTEIYEFNSVRFIFTFSSPNTEQTQQVSETFPVRVEAGPRFFIQPEDTGTAIKNSDGVINLRAFQVRPDVKGREELDLYGNDREYALVNNSDTRVGTETTANGTDVIQFSEADITGDIDVLLKRYDGGVQGEVLDSITLVDVTDGTDAVIGSVNAYDGGLDSNRDLSSGNQLDLGYSYDPNVNEFDPPDSDINTGGSGTGDNYYLVATFYRKGNVIEHGGVKMRGAAQLEFDETDGTLQLANSNGLSLTNVPTDIDGDGDVEGDYDYNISISSTGGGSRALTVRFAYSSTHPLESNYDVFETVVVSPGGVDGDNASVVTLESPSLTFTEDSDGNVSPGSITLTATAENIEAASGDGPADVWQWSQDGSSVSDGDAGVNHISETKSEYTVNQSDLGGDDSTSVSVTATDGPTGNQFSDSTTLVRLKDGSNAITPLLSNPSHTYQADADGSIDNPNTGDNTLTVYEGASTLNFAGLGTSAPSGSGEYQIDLSFNGMITGASVNTASGNAEISPTGNFGSNTASDNEGSIDVTVYVRKNNGNTVQLDNLKISYAKSVAGTDGDNGDPGPPGPGVVFRGEFDSSKRYYHRDDRRDVVIEGGTYYLADNTSKNGNLGSNWGTPNNSNWTTYGQQFDSVATDILLTQDATITKTLTMGNSSSDSGLIRSAVEVDVSSGGGGGVPRISDFRPIYEIGDFVDGLQGGKSGVEGIIYRNTNGDTVFEVSTDDGGTSELKNLDITGGVDITGGINLSTGTLTVNGGNIIMDTRTDSGGDTISGEISNTGGDFKIDSTGYQVADNDTYSVNRSYNLRNTSTGSNIGALWGRAGNSDENRPDSLVISSFGSNNIQMLAENTIDASGTIGIFGNTRVLGEFRAFGSVFGTTGEILVTENIVQLKQIESEGLFGPTTFSKIKMFTNGTDSLDNPIHDIHIDADNLKFFTDDQNMENVNDSGIALSENGYIDMPMWDNNNVGKPSSPPNGYIRLYAITGTSGNNAGKFEAKEPDGNTDRLNP